MSKPTLMNFIKTKLMPWLWIPTMIIIIICMPHCRCCHFPHDGIERRIQIIDIPTLTPGITLDKIYFSI